MTKIITGHIEDYEEVEISEPQSLYNIYAILLVYIIGKIKIKI